MLGPLETRSLRFQRVFVLDANEGALPEAGAESTLLPLSVRGSLGLSTYRDREDIAAYHFAVLAAGAQELHLFSVQSGEKERSRFAERLLWERQKEAGAREGNRWSAPSVQRLPLLQAAGDRGENRGDGRLAAAARVQRHGRWTPT